MLNLIRMCICAALLCGCGASATDALVADGLPLPHEVSADAEHYTLSAAMAVVEVQINGIVSYTLSFPKLTGKLFLDAEEPKMSVATLVVDMRSATTDNKEIEKVAKSEDFLHVEKYPEARFEVRQLSPKAESSTYEMVGVLELHGTTKAITVPFAMTIDDCATAASTEFAVNRRKFGVESDTFLDGVASDDVDIRVKIRVPRKTADASCTNPPPAN